MRPLIVYFIFAGIILSFYTGFLFKIVKSSLKDADSEEIKTKTAYIFVCLGIFEILGGIVSGYLADRVNKYLITTASTIVVELAIVVSILCLYLDNYALCFVCAALWGFADCIT